MASIRIPPPCGSGKLGTPLARMQREKATGDPDVVARLVAPESWAELPHAARATPIAGSTSATIVKRNMGKW